MQMLYGILAGNKVHLSEIACSLNETITLKKTIDRLSRNLFKFSEKDIIMDNYITEVKKQIDEYFKFKKQQFGLEDLRVMSLQLSRNLNLFTTAHLG